MLFAARTLAARREDAAASDGAERVAAMKLVHALHSCVVNDGLARFTCVQKQAFETSASFSEAIVDALVV